MASIIFNGENTFLKTAKTRDVLNINEKDLFDTIGEVYCSLAEENLIYKKGRMILVRKCTIRTILSKALKKLYGVGLGTGGTDTGTYNRLYALTQNHPNRTIYTQAIIDSYEKIEKISQKINYMKMP